MKKCILILCIALLLSGCDLRARVVPNVSGSADTLASESAKHAASIEQPGDYSDSIASGSEEDPNPNAPTQNDPNATRREFASDASAEISPDAENTLLKITEYSEAYAASEQAEDTETRSKESDLAPLKATETLPLDDAEDLGVSENAEVADSVFQYYETLLNSRLISLFECQRLYMYWETETDFETVFKTSDEHQIILLAGGYDVSVKRPEDALIVDEGWVARKNPGCIIKVVPTNILGRSANTTVPADTIYEILRNRADWREIDAVKAGKVVLISEELLRSPAGKLSAAVAIACAAYPDLFADTNPSEAIIALLTESAGSEVVGIYAYTKG